MDAEAPAAFPVEIVGIGRTEITIRWDDGLETRHDARRMRLACRCAMCVEEWTGKRLLDSTKVPWPLHCVGIEMVGNYGLRFTWSDGHDLGIVRLRELRASGDPPASTQ
jgi:ATP-binding protein involved in chromosome partitioning